MPEEGSASAPFFHYLKFFGELKGRSSTSQVPVKKMDERG